MAAPAYVNAGTGVTIASGSGACTLAGTTAGNTIILQVLQDGTAASAVTLSALSNVENLADTASAITTLAAAQPVGSPTAALQHLWIGRSLGGTVSVTVATTGDDLYYRLYEFSGAITDTTLAAVTESIANGVGTGTSVADTGVTTTAADRLALQFVAVNDDLAVGPFTGMTGGTWAEPVAEFASATGTDGCIQLQTGQTTVAAIDNMAAGSGDTAIWGASGTSTYVAQSFLPGAGTMVAVDLTLRKYAAPADNLIVQIQSDSAGVPSGVVLASSSISAASLTTSYASYSFALPVALSAATTYWIVLSRSGARDLTNYCAWRVSSSAYADGVQKLFGASSWGAAQASDLTFRVTASAAGTINGGTFTMVSGGWGVVGLALIPVPSGPATLTRSAALNATGLILVVGRETLARVAALNAVGAVTSSGIKVLPAVTYERSAALTVTAGIATVGRETLARTVALSATGQIVTAGISVVPGRAAINATATITAVGRETLARAAAVAASAQIASAGREQLARLAELACAAQISAAGQVVSGAGEVERSAALAGSAGIATTGSELLPRAAVITATASISTLGQRRVLRSAAVTATAQVTTTGDILGAAQRSAAVAATATVSASSVVVRLVRRTATLTATGTLQSVPQRALHRTATVTTAGTVAATGRLTLSRTAALETVAAITTVAGGNIGEASFGAFATITATLPLPAGAISTSTTGHVWAARRGGIQVTAEGDIATGGVGELARTGG